MADLQELVLRIGGESHEAQSAVSELKEHLTEQFHEMAGAVHEFEGSFTGVVEIAAIVAGAIAAITGAVVALGAKGAEVGDVEAGFRRLAGGAEHADDILKAMRTGVVGTIDDLHLMKDANELLAVGALKSADDFKTMTEAARVLSHEGFGPMQEMIDGVSRAMETGRTRRLAMMGVTVDAKKAEEDYARSLGIQTIDLTQNQKLHADRQAVMEALQKTVEHAGIAELNFAEKIDNVKTSLQNWFDTLAKNVSESKHVNEAFDAIVTAFQKLGDGESLRDQILQWVDRFADYVKEYGPYIVEKFGEMRDWIVYIWHAVKDAWDAVPDWLKNIARDVAIAGAAVWVGSAAFDGMSEAVRKVAQAIGGGGGASGGDMISHLGNLGTVLGNSKGIIASVTRALADLGAMTVAFGWEGFGVAIGGWIAPLTGAGTAIVAFTGSLEGMAGVLATAAIGLGGFVVVAGSAIAVGTALYNAYKLWSESRERDASAAKQSIVDVENLARINKELGTSYTDLNTAVIAAREHNKELQQAVGFVAGGVVDLTVDYGALDEQQNAFKRSVEQLVDTLEGDSRKMKQLSAAIGEVIKSHTEDIDVKTRVIDAIDRLMKAHVKLTEAQKAYYEENSYLGTQEKKNAEEIMALWAKEADAEEALMLKGLNLQRQRLDTEERNEIESWKRKVKVGEVGEAQADEAIEAVRERFTAQRTKLEQDAADAAVERQRDLQNKTLEAERDFTYRGLELQLRRLDAQRENEIHDWDQRLQDGKIAEEEYWDAIAEIDARFNGPNGLRAKALVDNEKENIKKTGALWDDYFKTLNSISMSSHDQQIADVQRWLANEKQAAEEAGTYDQGYYDALEALADAKIQKIEHDTKSVLLTLSDAFGNIAGSFAQLAQISDGSFGNVAKSIGGTVNVAKQLFDTLSATQNISQTAMESGGGIAGWSSAISSAAMGWVGVAIAAYQVISQIVEAVQKSHAEQEAAEELAKLSEKFRSTVSLSQELSKSIHDLNAAPGRDTNSGELLRLSDIIKEMGGVARLTKDELKAVEDTIKNGIWMPEEIWSGTVANGPNPEHINDHFDEIDAMDKALHDLGENAIKSTGLVDKFFIDTLKHARETGVVLAETNKLVSEQMGSAMEGLQTFLKNGEVTTAGSASAMGSAIAAVFGEMTRQGMSMSQALEKLKDPIAALNTQLVKAGLNGGESFSVLVHYSELAADKIAGPALDAVSGLNQMMQGLHNSGLLTQDMFSGLAGQVTDTFRKLVQQGYNGNEVMLMMGPTLQTIWEEEKDFGMTVDESTQALVDQGVQAGVVGEQHRSAQDQMRDAMNRTVDILTAIAEALGAKIPAATDKAKTALVGTANAAQSSLSGVRATLNDLNTDLLKNADNWQEWGDDAYHATKSATYGNSPGGLEDVSSYLDIVTQQTIGLVGPFNTAFDAAYTGTMRAMGGIQAMTASLGTLLHDARAIPVGGNLGGDSRAIPVGDDSRAIPMINRDQAQAMARAALTSAGFAVNDATMGALSAASGWNGKSMSLADATAFLNSPEARIAVKAALGATHNQAAGSLNNDAHAINLNMLNDARAIPSFAGRPLERVTGQGLAMLHPGDVVGVPSGAATSGGPAGYDAGIGALADRMEDIHIALTDLPDLFARKVRDAIQLAG